MNFEEIKNAVEDAYNRYKHFENDLAVFYKVEKMKYGQSVEINFKWFVGDAVASKTYKIEEIDMSCTSYYSDEFDNAAFTDLTLEACLQEIHKEFYNRGVEFLV